MRAAYSVPRCLTRLVPGAQFSVFDNDPDRIEGWQASQPLPTDAEMAAAWPLIQAQDAAEANNAAIRAQLDANDLKATRWLVDAMLSGDTARIQAHQAAQAELRAGFL